MKNLLYVQRICSPSAAHVQRIKNAEGNAALGYQAACHQCPIIWHSRPPSLTTAGWANFPALMPVVFWAVDGWRR